MVVHVKSVNLDLFHMHIAFAELVSLAVDVKLNILVVDQMVYILINLGVILAAILNVQIMF